MILKVVIPVKTGIQVVWGYRIKPVLDSGFRRSDVIMTFYGFILIKQ